MNRKGFAPIVILSIIAGLLIGTTGCFLLFRQPGAERKDFLNPESSTSNPTLVATSTPSTSAGCRFAGDERIYQNCLATPALSMTQFLDLLGNCKIKSTVFAHVGFVFTTKDDKTYRLNELADNNSTVINKALAEARKTCGPISGGIE